MRDFTDILETISNTLDPEEIVERLGISSVDLCDALADQIEDNLQRFYDLIGEEDNDEIEDLQDY